MDTPSQSSVFRSDRSNRECSGGASTVERASVWSGRAGSARRDTAAVPARSAAHIGRTRRIVEAHHRYMLVIAPITERGEGSKRATMSRERMTIQLARPTSARLCTEKCLHGIQRRSVRVWQRDEVELHVLQVRQRLRQRGFNWPPDIGVSVTRGRLVASRHPRCQGSSAERQCHWLPSPCFGRQVYLAGRRAIDFRCYGQIHGRIYLRGQRCQRQAHETARLPTTPRHRRYTGPGRQNPMRCSERHASPGCAAGSSASGKYQTSPKLSAFR